MPTVKRTTRRYLLSRPTGLTVSQKIRTYVRAEDGTDYPVDREIQVPQLEPIEVEYVCQPGTDLTVEAVTEQWVLSQYPAGTIAVACTDVVELVEV